MSHSLQPVVGLPGEGGRGGEEGRAEVFRERFQGVPEDRVGSEHPGSFCFVPPVQIQVMVWIKSSWPRMRWSRGLQWGLESGLFRQATRKPGFYLGAAET